MGHFLSQTKKDLQRPPLTTTPQTAAKDVVHELFRWHIHRLYTVDGQQRPTGVVTATDIIQALHSAISPTVETQ